MTDGGLRSIAGTKDGRDRASVWPEEELIERFLSFGQKKGRPEKLPRATNGLPEMKNNHTHPM
jgi:hypothetical protein